ncbi:uncharacterized protein K444DRAFT_339637 [Hyaloscypha bicolor E]|uniref:Uncharacterized protein n=1 Tax=Hyaloscypha bicolor E TaxID=1095630 RepID=A0A2J6TH21_9HELO|nr:uncharacterized protein K444DRAFT_339637 [Hyaloscypha bicolor E]PMD62329.1 hypothetical protein K444DRAFT_339637 [Hyaloscypha bicolor E]
MDLPSSHSTQPFNSSFKPYPRSFPSHYTLSSFSVPPDCASIPVYLPTLPGHPLPIVSQNTHPIISSHLPTLTLFYPPLSVPVQPRSNSNSNPIFIHNIYKLHLISSSLNIKLTLSSIASALAVNIIYFHDATITPYSPQSLDSILSLLNGSECNPMQAIQLHSINSARDTPRPHTSFPPPQISLNPTPFNQPTFPSCPPLPPNSMTPGISVRGRKTSNAAWQAVRSAWLGMKTR